MGRVEWVRCTIAAQTVSQAAMGKQGIQMSSDQISVRDRVRSGRNLTPDPLLPHQPAFK